jgi:transcription elongation factor GreA
MQREPMTQEGFDALSKEFSHLNTVLKPQVNKEKQIAAEHGDRSENAEYHAAKEKLRHIDKRLKYLSSLLDMAQIINPEELDHSKVCFGSTVTIENLDDETEQTLSIFGTLESEPEHGIITHKSPLAKALLGRSVEDEIKVTLPKGNQEFEILDIAYIPIMELKKEPFKSFDIQ